MKTAEEVAKYLQQRINADNCNADDIFEALTAYADERVYEALCNEDPVYEADYGKAKIDKARAEAEEALYWLKRKKGKREENHDEDCHCNDYKELARKAHDSALEEAAKIAEATERRIEHFMSPHIVCEAIADQIRALKDKV